jgi:hypothetical protein
MQKDKGVGGISCPPCGGHCWWACGNYAIIVIGKRGALFLTIISFSTMKEETGKGDIIMCMLMFSYPSSSCAYQKEE